MRSLKLRLLLGAVLLAVAALGASTGGVAAYGRAEQPLAQIEFSGNCNNPDFFLCAPPPAGFGLGGVWFWIEIDAGGTGDIAGAGCGHDRSEAVVRVRSAARSRGQAARHPGRRSSPIRRACTTTSRYPDHPARRRR
jgi:hypothetical protein